MQQINSEPHGPFDKIHLGSFLGLLLLYVILIISAISLVYTKHLSRILYAKLETLQLEKDNYHIEWSQLLLERGTLASDARVEQLARIKLNMQHPQRQDMLSVRP